MPAMYNAFQVMPCARQGMVFKRSMIEEEKYFDEKFKLMSDLDFIIRLLLKNAAEFFLTQTLQPTN